MVHPGNVRIPFADLIRLEKIDNRTYRSIAPPFSPGDELGPRRAYGGHVYAQAAWAACQTVSRGFVIHSIAGNFILAGLITVPFLYTVNTIRDGRSYCTRIVNVTQASVVDICFTCTVSFNIPESGLLDVQAPIDLWTEYASVLSRKRPSDFPLCPGIDTPSFVQRRALTGLDDAFPGLDMPQVDMGAYNATRHPLARRQLSFYRAIGSLSASDDPNLHLCAHLFASDRNSLFYVANHFDIGDLWTSMGSLSHHVVFHAPLADLLFRGSHAHERSLQDDPVARWFAKEDSTDRIIGGRGMCHCNLYAPNGVHVATIMQDGMIRLTKKPVATVAERETVQVRERAYPKLKLKEKL